MSVELFPTPVEPMATIFFTDMLGWVLVECCCSVFENNADESIEVKKTVLLKSALDLKFVCALLYGSEPPCTGDRARDHGECCS